MQDVMPIGRFAKLTGLTVKALRLYDDRGLLRPAVVDFASGYRYYSPEQVRLARDIRLLRAVNMPLADIQCLLTEDDPARVAAHLDRHRAKLTSQLRQYKQALALLPTAESWCNRTKKERTMEEDTQTYKCSFCGKDRAEIRRMIAGPNQVYICNECITLCNQILAQEEGKGATA